MSEIKAAITGIEGYTPDYVLSNHEIATMVDTSDEWITTRTGIKERRILKGEGKGTSDMGAEAVKRLLKKTNTSVDEIDLLICATVTPDMQFPATANVICDKVGIVGAMSFDLAAACSGFIYSLETARQFIESGKYKKVIVVGGDKMSSIINYEDRATCVIFGDGAGAIMLEPNSEGLGIQDSILKSDGQEDITYIKRQVAQLNLHRMPLLMLKNIMSTKKVSRSSSLQLQIWLMFPMK